MRVFACKHRFAQGTSPYQHLIFCKRCGESRKIEPAQISSRAATTVDLKWDTTPPDNDFSLPTYN